MPNFNSMFKSLKENFAIPEMPVIERAVVLTIHPKMMESYLLEGSAWNNMFKDQSWPNIPVACDVLEPEAFTDRKLRVGSIILNNMIPADVINETSPLKSYIDNHDLRSVNISFYITERQPETVITGEPAIFQNFHCNSQTAADFAATAHMTAANLGHAITLYTILDNPNVVPCIGHYLLHQDDWKPASVAPDMPEQLMNFVNDNYSDNFHARYNWAFITLSR